MREEFRQRLADEYRLAATKMREAKQPARKLFYFSVCFGEAQRVLNWEWDRDLALIYTVAQHVHTQINGAGQLSNVAVLPIDWAIVYEKLTEATSDLAACFEKSGDDNREEMYEILGRLAEIAYAISGNGSYLYEKGLIKL